MLSEPKAFQRFIDLTAKYLDDIEQLAAEYPPLQSIVSESPLAETKELVNRARMLSDVLKEEPKNAN